MAKSLKQAYDYWQNQPDLNCVSRRLPPCIYTRQKGGETAAHIARIDDLVDVLYFVFFSQVVGNVCGNKTNACAYIYVHIIEYTYATTRLGC